MRMATDELVVDVARDVGHREGSGVRRDLGVQHHLHEHVSELLAQVRLIAGLDAVQGLVSLLDHVLADALVGLFAIPRATIGLAQAPDRLNEGLHLLARVGKRRGVARDARQTRRPGLGP